MITIAWDVDDVLNDLTYSWLSKKWLPEHPDCKISFGQLLCNPPQSIIGCKKEEYLSSLDNFRLSEAYHDMEPNTKVLAWFEKYGSKARHMALTSVPIKAAHISAEWVIKNFGKWIRSFNFVPSLRRGEGAPEYDHNKADYLKWFDKIDILVEDDEQNIDEAEQMSIKGILVKRPWNKGRLSIEDALREINNLIMEK